MKDGKYTTEFWIAAFIGVAGAGIALLMSYGVFSNEQAAAWQTLIESIAPVAVILIIGWLAKSYGDNRTALKMQVTEAATEAARLERLEDMPEPVQEWHPISSAASNVEVKYTSTKDGGEWVWHFDGAEDGD